MSPYLPTLSFLALTSALAAQSLTVTVAAASASSLSATLGGPPQTTSVQAGPLGLQGARFATDSNSANLIAHSEFSWNATVDAYSLLVFLDAAAFVDSGTAGQADSGPHDFLVTLSSPTPITISLELTRQIAGTPGNPLPVTRIDLGDDGTFELDELSASTVNEGLIVGPTPVPIRCQFGAAIVGPGSVYGGLRLSGTPGSVDSGSLLPGCAGIGFVTSPRFDGNLDHWISVGHSGLAAAVLGLDTQPLYLGSQAAGPFGPVLPCVLMPRPDLVILLPSLAPQTLVVPPAARPVWVYSQAVLYDGVALRTSRAFETRLW